MDEAFSYFHSIGINLTVYNIGAIFHLVNVTALSLQESLRCNTAVFAVDKDP